MLCVILWVVCVGEREGSSGGSFSSVGVGLTLLQVKSTVPGTRGLEAFPSGLSVCLQAVALAAAASSLLTPSCHQEKKKGSYMRLILFALSQNGTKFQMDAFKEFRGTVKGFFFSHTLTAL